MVVELAAGALAAEELVSSTIYTGVAAYAVTKSTLPLKATFVQIATFSGEETKLSLNRSHHSITVIKDKAYIFGGRVNDSTIAGNEIHAVSLLPEAEAEKVADTQYAVIPAVSDAKLEDDKNTGSAVPSARYNHSAASLNVCVAIFGGLNEKGKTIKDNRLWLFNTAKSSWEHVKPATAPPPRSNATLSPLGNGLVLYGGQSSTGTSLKDVWHFDYAEQTWHEIPDAPVADAKAVVASDELYLLSFPDNLSATLHSLDLSTITDKTNTSPPQWQTHTIPINPLISQLKPREGALAVPITYGHGRSYLLYFLGKDHSDAWVIQLPSTKAAVTHPKASGATIKDSIRGAVGANSGTLEVAEVEISLPKALDSAPAGAAGKLHPGPRAWAAADVSEDQHTVILWGGTSRIDAGGHEEATEGDGWMIKIEQ